MKEPTTMTYQISFIAALFIVSFSIHAAWAPIDCVDDLGKGPLHLEFDEEKDQIKSDADIIKGVIDDSFIAFQKQTEGHVYRMRIDRFTGLMTIFDETIGRYELAYNCKKGAPKVEKKF